MIYSNFTGRVAKKAKVIDGVNGQFLSMDLAVNDYSKGEDDRDFSPNETADVRKSRISGRIDYLNNEIDELKKEKLTLAGSDDYISMSDKAFVDSYKASLNILTHTLDSLVEDLEKAQKRMVLVREEKNEFGLFLIRLK